MNALLILSSIIQKCFEKLIRELLIRPTPLLEWPVSQLQQNLERYKKYIQALKNVCEMHPDSNSFYLE